MGLLSDPSLSTHNKLVECLAKYVRLVCYIFYIAGVTWFICLALPDLNHGTYLSENALSPGLVYPEVRIDANRLAVELVEELQTERKNHKSTTPHAWIAAKFNEFGLETHTHNYTLHYPFGGGNEYHGKNVYGILRAPRIGSTEGIVISAPYRVPNSVHTDISPSVPLLLAFAEFARRKNYWAKDLIFLVTEQEHLGMQAWLQAYHEGDKEVDYRKAHLMPGNVPARAGALQAALNIEVQDLEIDHIDVKIEGLNGKLPNLDMFNLVQRIMARENLVSGYKQTPHRNRRASYSAFEQNLRHVLAMLRSQSSGVPNGNHGFFHRYRIDALTLTAVKRVTNGNTKSSHTSSAIPLLKAIEGIARSLNNLLERFHQSFFFYIIVHNDRYISIGDYMPALVALVACLFIKAYLTWFTLDAESAETPKQLAEKPCDAEEENDGELDRLPLPYDAVLVYFTAALLIGYLGNALPLQEYFLQIPISAAPVTSSIVITLTLIGTVLPFIVVLPPGGLELMHIGFLLIYGCVLIVVGLLNFALGFFLAVVSVPLIIALNTNAAGTPGGNSNTMCALVRLYTLLLNPLLLIYAIVFGMTFYQLPELTLQQLFFRAVTASMDAVTFALVDSVIYGNWLYFAVCTVFFPLWIVCWTLAIGKRRNHDYDADENEQEVVEMLEGDKMKSE